MSTLVPSNRLLRFYPSAERFLKQLIDIGYKVTTSKRCLTSHRSDYKRQADWYATRKYVKLHILQNKTGTYESAIGKHEIIKVGIHIKSNLHTDGWRKIAEVHLHAVPSTTVRCYVYYKFHSPQSPLELIKPKAAISQKEFITYLGDLPTHVRSLYWETLSDIQPTKFAAGLQYSYHDACAEHAVYINSTFTSVITSHEPFYSIDDNLKLVHDVSEPNCQPWLLICGTTYRKSDRFVAVDPAVETYLNVVRTISKRDNGIYIFHIHRDLFELEPLTNIDRIIIRKLISKLVENV